MANVQRFWPSQKVSNWLSTDSGIAWSGSTANGIGTYSSSSEIVAESTATYDGTTLSLTTSGGGISLDGLSSSSATTLDDYEEGLFTGALTPASGTITIDGNFDQLSFTKIGRLVSIHGTLEMGSVSSPSGNVTMNLPFTAANTTERSARTGFFYHAGGLVSGEDNLFGTITENTAIAKLNYGNGGTGGGGTNMGAQIDSGSFFQFAFSYIAAT